MQVHRGEITSPRTPEVGDDGSHRRIRAAAPHLRNPPNRLQLRQLAARPRGLDPAQLNAAAQGVEAEPVVSQSWRSARRRDLAVYATQQHPLLAGTARLHPDVVAHPHRGRARARLLGWTVDTELDP